MPTRCRMASRGSRLAARGKDWTPNRHDTGSTTARSVDEIALILDTINHYGPVFIASLTIQIRRAGVQKKFAGRAALVSAHSIRRGPATHVEAYRREGGEGNGL